MAKANKDKEKGNSNPSQLNLGHNWFPWVTLLMFILSFFISGSGSYCQTLPPALWQYLANACTFIMSYHSIHETILSSRTGKGQDNTSPTLSQMGKSIKTRGSICIVDIDPLWMMRHVVRGRGWRAVIGVSQMFFRCKQWIGVGLVLELVKISCLTWE